MEQVIANLQTEIDKTKLMAGFIKQQIVCHEHRDNLMSMIEFEEILSSLYSDLSANSNYLRGLQFALELVKKHEIS